MAPDLQLGSLALRLEGVGAVAVPLTTTQTKERRAMNPIIVVTKQLARARVWYIAFLVLLLAAPVDAAIRDQTWQIVIEGQAAQLKLETTSFFIASPEEVAEA